MRSLNPENVAEHSLQVAVVAHALAVIKNKYFGGNINPERVALLALFHDASEVITGDLPTPVKYFSRQIQDAYKEMETHAETQLLRLLPQDLWDEYRGLISPKTEGEDPENMKILKSADTLCAYIKCLEEIASGNPEFARAQKSIEEKLRSSESPEVKYFFEKFVPSFSLTLDELHPEN